MALPSSSTTTGAGNRDGTAKASVADQISQAVQSTSNLLHLMQQSSPSQAYLVKLPKSLLLKTSTIKNTAQVLQQLPQVVSSLDAYTEDGLHSVPHLKTVSQLLSNMESTIFHPNRSQEDPEIADLNSQQKQEGN